MDLCVQVRECFFPCHFDGFGHSSLTRLVGSLPLHECSFYDVASSSSACMGDGGSQCLHVEPLHREVWFHRIRIFHTHQRILN